MWWNSGSLDLWGFVLGDSESFGVLPIDIESAEDSFAAGGLINRICGLMVVGIGLVISVDGKYLKTRRGRSYFVCDFTAKRCLREGKPHCSYDFICSSSSYLCKQETLWIFFCRKLIWSEPKGLLLCLREAKQRKASNETRLFWTSLN